MYDNLTLEDLAKARRMIGPSTNEMEQNKLKKKEETNAVLRHSFSVENDERSSSHENLRSLFSCQACIIPICVCFVIIIL